MKTLLFLLMSGSFCCAQNSKVDYIAYANFASEAEYYFHEEMYDSAIYYYEYGLQYVDEPNPDQHYKYVKALWKIGNSEKALLEVLPSQRFMLDTTYFRGLNQAQYNQINLQLKENYEGFVVKNNIAFYENFMDSILNVDQVQRDLWSARLDSIPFPNRKDSLRLWKPVAYHDSCNAEAVIEFTRKYGFPGGKNLGWSHLGVSTFLIHRKPEWLVENYALLYREVVRGNLEPWMLGSGIDRMFVVDVGEDKISPNNRYWTESIVNPFLMFYNCTSLGISPYYDYNWFEEPRKTIHFDYYKENKEYYNTTFQYVRNRN